MQQQGDNHQKPSGNSSEMNPKNPDQGLRPDEPQKCPRCDSMNTKFCYYNNYSLTQPRYFCKTCRRYWTQGGTLRNVPVGGGCRKGKRAKTSSSSQQPPPQGAAQQEQQLQKSLELGTVGMSTTSIPTAAATDDHYFPGTHGFLSSFSAMNQSLNPPLGFSELGGGGGGASSSLSGLLQGFNGSATSYGSSQQQHQQPHQFYPKINLVDQPALYPSEQESLLLQSTRAASDQLDWPSQNFNRSSLSVSAASETSLWAMGNSNNPTTTTSGNINTNINWPDLPGRSSFGPSQ